MVGGYWSRRWDRWGRRSQGRWEEHSPISSVSRRDWRRGHRIIPIHLGRIARPGFGLQIMMLSVLVLVLVIPKGVEGR